MEGEEGEKTPATYQKNPGPQQQLCSLTTDLCNDLRHLLSTLNRLNPHSHVSVRTTGKGSNLRRSEYLTDETVVQAPGSSLGTAPVEILKLLPHCNRLVQTEKLLSRAKLVFCTVSRA